ncbi:MAG: pknB 30 [Planctomycetaceae bacterium]|nr:pknB 30 [Planctomycetaceae bacterium]
MEPSTPLSNGTPGVQPEKPLEEAPAQDSVQESVVVSMTTTKSFSVEPRPVESRSATLPDLPGRLQDRYVFRSVLGQGGFGCVFEAWDEVLHRTVAIKLARRDRFDGTKGRQRFLDEARAAAKLKHPHIVMVYDSGTDADGNPFVVFEFIDGDSLSARMKRQPLSRDESLAVMITVSEAVHVAHKAGLVHRDLKPANILIDKAGQAHVTDFGLAVDEHSQREQAGQVAGSPQYMSPEQLRGETQYLDGRTDIWSLGVILYELLAHRRPFSGRNIDELRDEILNREPKPLRQIDESISLELERTCLQCLMKSVPDRISSAADLALSVRRCRQPASNQAWKLKVGMTVVLLAIGILAFAFLRPDPEKRLVDASEGRPVSVSAQTEPIPVSTDKSASIEPAMPIPGTWFPVLTQSPKLLEWPADSKNSRWQLEPERHQLWVTCERRCLMKFGRVETGDFQIQCNLFQSPWSGQIGIFWGRHQQQENGVECYKIQLLDLQVRKEAGQMKSFLQRAVLTRAMTGKERDLNRTTFAAVPLADLAQRDQQLQLVVQGGRVTRIRWGDQILSDLMPAHTDQFVTLNDSYGDWGIWLDNSSGVFRNLELFLQPKGDQ